MRSSQGYGDGASTSECTDTDDDAIFEMELEPAGPALPVPMRHPSLNRVSYCCVLGSLKNPTVTRHARAHARAARARAHGMRPDAPGCGGVRQGDERGMIRALSSPLPNRCGPSGPSES